MLEKSSPDKIFPGAGVLRSSIEKTACIPLNHKVSRKRRKKTLGKKRRVARHQNGKLDRVINLFLPLNNTPMVLPAPIMYIPYTANVNLSRYLPKKVKNRREKLTFLCKSIPNSFCGFSFSFYVR